MPLSLPHGKTLAVAITADFDAHSNWLGAGLASPSYMARGEFGAEVGLPRLLKLLQAHAVRATFCTPGQVVVTYPELIRGILGEGHEVAAHGCYHESLLSLEPAVERRLLERQIEQHVSVTGGRPRGFRAPGWEVSESTLGLLEEFGFDWDSSLMGRDFEPYHPRPLKVDRESASTFGAPSSVLEIPVSWYLDDFSFFEFAPALGLFGGVAPQVVLDIWTTNFDFALENVKGGAITLTVHPQTIGRPQNLQMLERFLQHVDETSDAWYGSMSEIHDRWQDSL